MNVTIEGITALIAACGLPIIIPKIIDFYKAIKTGKAVEEKRNNRNALGRLVAETDRADNEAAYRRIMQEYASGLRRLLIDWGYPEDKLPKWPTRPAQE